MRFGKTPRVLAGAFAAAMVVQITVVAFYLPLSLVSTGMVMGLSLVGGLLS